MKYKNAKDIFPENLLRQIQKYVSGELIYIPSDTQKKKEWRETSGYRRYLYERNLGELPAQAERKAGMTSNQHGPYVRGDTRATIGAF